MKGILIALFAGIFFIGCNNYTNKTHYTISVNETVGIYFSTNSCCYPCIPNRFNLKHLSHIDTKTIDTGPDDCAGCNYTGELVFRGESVGIDTIEIKILSMNTDCDTNDILPEIFIVEVK